MSTSVFLNGTFFGGEGAPPISQARVSAFDAGFQHALGLFETMLGGVLHRGIEGPRTHGEEIETWVLQLDDHMERLAASARELGLSDQLRPPALAAAALETVRRSGLSSARVRLTITGGDLSLLAAAQAGGHARPADPTILIVAQPATEYPRPMFDRGVAVTLADARANPLNPFEGHKVLNYWWRLRELQAAASKGAAEAVVLSVTNHLVGGCVSNILLVKGDTLLTPIARGEERETAGKNATSLSSPVLPGVTRAWALDKAERLGLGVKKRMLAVQDLLDADEVMLTNSSWGILPVVRIEGSDIGPDGARDGPGRITRDLRDAWLASLPSSDDLL
jgi:branched-subunit amino acid aminotransferase/4-amino-4-deoxychorismate lyase